VPQTPAPPPLRTHQAQALTALDQAWDEGRRRAWVVLPPGAGKTRVGLETIVRLLGEGASRAVVLAPNTAIQAQWVATAREHGLVAGVDRDLTFPVTCLTYQSVAVFDTDAEVDDDPEATDQQGETGLGGVLLDRLHANGRELVDRLAEVDGLVLVLDECHHLLEVWGRLLGELLHLVEDAAVLGLTATPPDALTPDQARQVDELFGSVAYRVGVPAVVKEGHLAPFAELAWLTTPTAHEEEWLAAEATRWRELTTYLTDPSFGSVPFLEWVRARFVTPVPHVQPWSELCKAEPELTDAALRLVHADLLDLPEGARLLEQHRRDPDADDWAGLLDDWARRHLSGSDDPRDAEVLGAVRAALPSVGYVLTRRGVRRGRTPIDRVLARSHAKTTATVEIVAHELTVLGARTRMLVLCDHERASATLPTGLQGVIDVQSGSARATLEALVTDPTTAALSPMLVTGSTVAGARETLEGLVDHVVAREPRWAGRLEVVGDGPVATVEGAWSPRHWVGHVTAWFEQGRTQVLVGTRGLLGEGWDARSITGLVDLTTATTLTAVVQTRGRALRVDPRWPEKVATSWTVVCVSDAHPKGANDWGRLVRKHHGFFGVDEDGDVVDGVGHLDATFSPYSPPPVDEFAAVNARMRERADQRPEVRARWRVGEEYADRVAATLRVVSPHAAPVVAVDDRAVARLALVPPAVVLGPGGAELRDPAVRPEARTGWPDPAAGGVAAASAVLAGASPVLASAVAPVAAAAAGAVGVAGLVGGLALLRDRRRDRTRAFSSWVAEQAARAGHTPTVAQCAAAVADALEAAHLTRVGSASVVVEVHPGGEYRCRLDAAEEDAHLFAVALDELLAPMATPRYVLSRATFTGRPRLGDDVRLRTPDDAVAALRALEPDGVVWHQVPEMLGVNADRARCLLTAWRHWVGDGEILFTGSPAGAGVLAAQQGSDPFAATTVMRRHWR
jgi:superfamily II DNA or RNA helicase